MKKTNRKAFTLVEIVIVIAVIGILAGVMIPVFGGIIDSANEANDKSIAANLSIAISQELDGINSAQELYDVIKATYGEDFANNMTPKSAKQGNHFWYDAKTKRVELATYDGLSDIKARTTGSATGRVNSGTSLASAITVAENDYTPFESNSLRSFDNGRFYLIDMSGSDIINKVAVKLDALANTDDYINVVSALKSDEYHAEDIEIRNQIKTKLESTAIINEIGVFAGSSTITNIYIPTPKLESPEDTYVLGSQTYVYSSDTETLTSSDRISVVGTTKYDITIPENVQIGTFGLIGMKVDDSDSMWSNSTTLHINTTKDKLTDYVVGETAVNCVIEISDGSRYIQQGGFIYELTETGVSSTPVNDEALAPTKNVGNYTIEVESDNFNYDANSNTIYVAYNAETLSLGLSNIVAQDGSKLSINGAKFELNLASGETVAQVEDSLSNSTKITIPETAKDFSITIKVAGCTKTVDVKIVKVSKVYFTDADLAGFEFKYDNTNTIPDMSITIPYSSLEYAPISIKPTYELNYPDCGIELEPEISITGSDSFTYTYEKNSTNGKYEGTLTVKNTTFGTEKFNLIITCDGVTNTATYSVTLKDVSAAPFEKSDAVTTVESYKDVNNAKMIYHVGNKDTLPLNYLVKVASGKTIPSGRKIIVDFYSGNTKLRDTQNLTSISDTIAMPTSTGTVTMKVGIGGETFDLSIKIVDGKNVLNLAGWEAVGSTTGIVLHTDLTISYNASKTSGKAMDAKYSKNMGGKTLSGNMHKITVSEFYVTAAANNYFIYMTGGKVENVAIEGAYYGSSVAKLQSEGSSKGTFVAGIETTGITMENCYISNFRQPLRVDGGTATLNNVVIKGGNWANVHVHGTATLNLTNVTTIQYEQDSHIGAGIFLNETATNVVIKASNLTQYNYITQDQMKMLVKAHAGTSVSLSSSDFNKLANVAHNSAYHGGIVLWSEKEAGFGTKFKDASINASSSDIDELYVASSQISKDMSILGGRKVFVYGLSKCDSSCSHSCPYSASNAYTAQIFLDSRK